ncbi:hypothetical protein [Hansschlegelia sp. KR7-227]|uniref:hypothetical protein n=1 Tax=Hansschlegelia sp. KR7-227 TaxID=3400914 RepID=UPI003C082BDA
MVMPAFDLEDWERQRSAFQDAGAMAVTMNGFLVALPWGLFHDAAAWALREAMTLNALALEITTAQARFAARSFGNFEREQDAVLRDATDCLAPFENIPVTA